MTHVQVLELKTSPDLRVAAANHAPKIVLVAASCGVAIFLNARGSNTPSQFSLDGQGAWP